METPNVQLRPGSLWINGQPEIIFSSSLFYFRLAAEEWRSRMDTLLRLGYNAIDVYFPWNYHELSPGKWDFEGQRDAAGFLQMAKEAGLWVIARPGPYICSEWDGGALPAYLNIDPELRLRSSDPAYLEAVRGWYDQILPIIARFQIERGGSVIMLQLENELDFYDSLGRSDMMRALREMALAHGIHVPLIACAGQGDIPAATGSIEGIVPTCNVYFDERDPHIESRVRHYFHQLAGRGFPLCIIETNRSHADLRRLILAGAKLVGPYLQAGGTDFGFTTGITNWGSPLAFMTSHYDFHGMLSPGGVVRPEGMEARLLTRMLAALGPAAALAVPLEDVPVAISGRVVPSALALDQGGYLIGLANPGEEAALVSVGAEEDCFPLKVALQVPPKRCPFVLFGLPLQAWGIDGQLVYATAELVGRSAVDDRLELTFVVSEPAEIALQIAGAALGENAGWETEHVGDTWRIWKSGQKPALLELRLPNQRRLQIRAVDRESAAGFSLSTINPVQPELSSAAFGWQLEMLDPCGPEWLSDGRSCAPGTLFLEKNGIFRGYGWYRNAGLKREPMGLLLRSGADVLSVYTGGCYLGTLAPGGLDAYLPWQPGCQVEPNQPLLIRAEIWGHANFDDARLPSLRLKSLRGIGGAAAVWSVDNLTPTWFYQDGALSPAESVDPDWPYLYFGGWSTTHEPAPGIYYRTVHFAEQGDTRVLHFPELQVDLRVYVKETLAGRATPHNGWVDLSSVTQPGETARLAVAVDRRLRLSTGQVLLYQGQSLPEWQVAGWGEADFARLANSPAAETASVELPIALAAGTMAWLHGTIPETYASAPGWDMVFEGKGLKITAWLGERLVGRIWLPDEKRPRMAGGADLRINLPGAWMRAANGRLHLLVESTGDPANGELFAVNLALSS